MENEVREYLSTDNRSEPPTLSEFVTVFKNDIVDFFASKESMITVKDVKAQIIFNFTNVMQSQNRENFRANKRDIDWDQLASLANQRQERLKITNDLRQLRTQIYDEEIRGNNSTLSVDANAIKVKIAKWRQDNGASDEVLSYNILDFVTEPNPGTKRVLGNHFDVLRHLANKRAPHDDAEAAKRFAERILKKMSAERDDTDLLKIFDTGLQQQADLHELHKMVRKTMKVFRKQFKHGHNVLEEVQTEGNYVAAFLCPLFERVLCDLVDFCTMWGEGKLKAVHYMDNDALSDSERRSTSANVDGKLFLRSHDIELCVIEVSGPPAVRNHTHFIGDRKKLALNLKKMFRYIISKNPEGAKSSLKELKLYGLQFYDHQFYIYSVSMPFWGVMVFHEEKKLALPVKLANAKRQLPRLIKTLWRLKGLLTSSASTIYEYLDSQDSSSSDNSECHSSQNKQQKTRGSSSFK